MVVDYLIYGRINSARITAVGLDRPRTPTRLGYSAKGLARRIGIVRICHYHTGTLAREAPCDAGTDSAGPAGDHCHFLI
jgi:hypothetical protein